MNELAAGLASTGLIAGRTGIDLIRGDLTRNPDVMVRDVMIISNSWHVLRAPLLTCLSTANDRSSVFACLSRYDH